MKIGYEVSSLAYYYFAPNIIICVWSLSYLSKYSLISLKNDAECGLAFHYSTSIRNCIIPLLDNRALQVWPVLVYVVYATSIHERISSVCVEY